MQSHSLGIAITFTAGLLSFLALGATATVVGQLLHAHRAWVGRIGGILVIALGIYLLGAFNLALLARERRVHIGAKPLGYLGTVLVGMAFAAGWTPCIGPILGGVLAYTASSADLPRGMALLLAYSLGLAVPFIAAALAVDRLMALFQRHRSAMLWTSRASGALLVLVGTLMVTGSMTVLSAWLQRWTPGFLWSRL